MYSRPVVQSFDRKFIIFSLKKTFFALFFIHKIKKITIYSGKALKKVPACAETLLI